MFEQTAGLSSEHRILTAAEILASSSFDDTAAAFIASGLFLRKEDGVL